MAPRKKKQEDLQKLWTIRMPIDLLEDLRTCAAGYGLPTQTFTKYVLSSGLIHFKKTGVILATSEDEKALLAHQRRLIVEASKSQRFQDLVDEVEKDGPLEATVLAQAVPYDAGHDVVTRSEDLPDDAPFSDLSEVEAFLEGGSSLKASLSVAKQDTPIVVPEVDILAEIGGDQTLDTSRSEDSEMNEDDIADLISSF